jgi:hypothetical protein
VKIISVTPEGGKTYYVETLDDKTSRQEYKGDEFAFVYRKREATRFWPEEIEKVLRRLRYECASDVSIEVLEEPWGIRIVARA